MASEQTLSVRIEGDTSGLTKATDAAATSLSDLKKDVQAIDGESIDLAVDVGAETATKELSTLKGDIDEMDGESIEVSAEVQMGRVNRDLGNLNRVLDGIERRKADPDVGLDLVQLTKDEAKVRKAINDLERQKVDIGASLDVDTDAVSGLSLLTTSLGVMRSEIAGGGGGAGLIGGLGLVSRGLRGVQVEATAAGAGFAAAAAGTAATVTGVGALFAVLAKGTGFAVELGESAADVETSVAQLDALTLGHGVEEFKELQKWAASTPFAIDDATEATKRLVAAGVPLKDIPDQLNDLGNVAAATGVPLSQIATVFSQMESSGKTSLEDLQQLAEAGIPVYQVLADKLGLSTDAIKTMASEGKLGKDSIDLLRESLNDLFPTAMADQADTFNGQVSTLHDNLDQVGSTLGILVLPAMKDVVSLLNDFTGAVLEGAQAVVGWNTSLQENMGGAGIVELLSPGLTALKFLADKFKGSGDAATDMGDQAAAAAKKVKDQIAAAAVSPELLQKAFEASVKALGDIGVNVRAHVSFIISQTELQREIDKATSGKKAVQLPANLNIKQLRGLSNKQFEIIQSLSSYAEQGLQRGMELAASDPNFDFTAFYKKLRAQLKPLLIQANVDPKQVDRVLTNILGIPRPVAVKPVVKDYEDARDKMNAPLTVPVKPKVVDVGAAKNDIGQIVKPREAPLKATPTNVGPANQTLDMTADERKAWMKALTTNVGNTDDILDGLAATRTVHYKLVLDESLYAHMDDRLDRLAGSRTATIRPSVAGPAPTGVPQAGVMWSQPLAEGPMLMAARQLSAPEMFLPSQQQKGSVVVAQPAPQPERLGPRQTPVAVYLDGHEISTQLDLRAGRLASVGSVRGRRA